MDPKVCGKLLTTHGEGDDVMMKASVMDPPPVELRNRLQDGISTRTEAMAVELRVSLCSRSFWGKWTYIGRRRAPGDARVGLDAGGRALERGACPPPSRATRGSSDVVLKFLWRDFLQKYLSRRFHSVWTPFDIPFLQNPEIGKKTAIWTGPLG